MSDDNKARDRIAKLLNMTTANGCTEDEAETALRMAAGIAVREGIDLDSCRAKDAPKIKAKMKAHIQAWKPHQTLCAQAAAELFGIECNAYNLGANGFSFVGREELIEMAEDTMFWLFRQVEELYKIALPKGLSKTERGEFRKTFKAACALRVWERSVRLMNQMRRDDKAAQAATGHNALVVQGHFDQLKAEVDEYWDERFAISPEQQARIDAANQREQDRRNALTPAQREREDRQREREAEKAAKRKPRRERSIPMGSGTQHGFDAGDRVQLRKEVR